MTIFGYTLVKKDELEKLELNLATERSNSKTYLKLMEEFKHQVKTLREFQREEQLKDVIAIDIGDPTPDPTA